MHNECAEIPQDVLFKQAWASTQHLEALQQRLHSNEGADGSADAADGADAEPATETCVLAAMTHCLSILHSGSNTAEVWQPGRRDYRLLANMTLRVSRCFVNDPYGSCARTAVLMSLLDVFLLTYHHSRRPSDLNDTAGPTAVIWLTRAEKLLAMLWPTGAADTLATCGFGPTVLVVDLLTATVTAATSIFGTLR